MKFVNIVCLFSLLFFNSLFAQKTKDIPVFIPSKKGIELRIVPYAWANELRLQVKGKVRSMLANGSLSVNIFYNNRVVKRFSTSVVKGKKRGEYKIHLEKEPINKAAQRILSGNYAVKVEFLLEHQTKTFQDAWRKKFAYQQPLVVEKTFVIKSSLQGTKFKKFYLKIMHNLNNLYAKLQEGKKHALKTSGEFAENGKFSSNKWRSWLYSDFSKQVDKEKKALEQHFKKIFAIRYDRTHGSLMSYCSILSRLGRLETFSLFKHHGVKISKRNLKIDMLAIKNKRDLNRAIEILHEVCAQELKIDLVKEFGYFPPPKR